MTRLNPYLQVLTRTRPSTAGRRSLQSLCCALDAVTLADVAAGALPPLVYALTEDPAAWAKR